MRRFLRNAARTVPALAFAFCAASAVEARDLGVSLSLGSSTKADVGVSVGGGSGISANVGASSVGATGASAGASLGGGNGANANVSLGGGGIGTGINLGLGGSASGGGNGTEGGSNSGSGGAGRYYTLISDMSSRQATVYRKRCVTILAQSAGYDRDLVGLCRALGNMKR